MDTMTTSNPAAAGSSIRKLRLPDDVWADVCATAAERGVTPTQVVRDALAEYLYE